MKGRKIRFQSANELADFPDCRIYFNFSLGQKLAQILPPNLTNMTKIIYLQALIDSSMPAELKKCNETLKKFACTLNFDTW